MYLGIQGFTTILVVTITTKEHRFLPRPFLSDTSTLSTFDPMDMDYRLVRTHQLPITERFCTFHLVKLITYHTPDTPVIKFQLVKASRYNQLGTTAYRIEVYNELLV